MESTSSAQLAFGTAVRELRRERDLTQDALGLEAALDRSYMGQVERGERNVSLLNVVKIAGGLGVKPSQIFERAEQRGLMKGS